MEAEVPHPVFEGNKYNLLKLCPDLLNEFILSVKVLDFKLTF